MIYAMILVCHTPIHVAYHEKGTRICVRNRIPGPNRYGYRDESIPDPVLPFVKSFAALSLVGYQIGREARSFFYAHNTVRFSAVPFTMSLSFVYTPWFHKESEAHKSKTEYFFSPPYFEGFVRFLACMGEEGRQATTKLELMDLRERELEVLFLPDHERFFGLLGQCTNLTTLCLSITADHVTAADPGAYHQYLLGRAVVPRRALRVFASHFSRTSLPHLEVLTLSYTVCERELRTFYSLSNRMRKRWKIAWLWVVSQIHTMMAVLEGLLKKGSRAQVMVWRCKTAMMVPHGDGYYQQHRLPRYPCRNWG
jgi:hypothetical protein